MNAALPNTQTTNVADGQASFQHIPLNCLVRSKENIRTVSPDKGDDQVLIASIASQGLLTNLVVRPSTTTPEHYDVLGGGRRLSAMQYLVSQGKLADNAPVPCKIESNGSAAAVSLAENLHAPTHPYDQYMAFQKMIDQGMDEQAIAAHFGIHTKDVKKRLELAKVHPTIGKAYAKGSITLDTVMAFTVAANQKTQLAVYRMLGKNNHHPNSIRRAITEEMTSSDSAIARFVGLAAYEKAGGGLTHDLFSDKKYLTNNALLVELAEKKLTIAAKKLHKEGWSNVTTQLNACDLHDYVQVEAKPANVPNELQENIQTTLELLAALDELEEWTDEAEKQYSQLEDQLNTLECKLDNYRAFTDEDRQRCRCFVSVDAKGKINIQRGLIHRDDIKQEKPAQSGKTKPSNALSNALQEELGRYRQQAIQLELTKKPQLARDLLLFTLCQQVFGKSGCHHSLIDINARNHIQQSPALKETHAYQALNETVGKLATDWLTKKTPKAQFDALQALSNTAKQRLLTYCVAQSIDIGLSHRAISQVPEMLAEAIAPNYYDVWRPTADNYFSRLNKKQLLTHGETFFSKTWAKNHANISKKELVKLLHEFFHGEPKSHYNKQQHEIIKTWLPEGFLAKKTKSKKK